MKLLEIIIGIFILNWIVGIVLFLAISVGLGPSYVFKRLQSDDPLWKQIIYILAGVQIVPICLLVGGIKRLFGRD